MFTIVQRSGSNLDKPIDIARRQASRLSWAWDGLCFGVPFHETSSEGYRDVVSNDAADVVGTNTWIKDNRGNSALYMTTSPKGWINYSANPYFQRPTTELTAYVRGRRVSSLSPYGGILTFPWGLAWPYMSWSIQNDPGGTGNIYGTLTVDGALNILDTTTNGVPTTEFVSVFLRWKSGEAPRFDVLGERGNTLFGLTHGGTITGSITYSGSYGPYINSNESAEVASWEYSQAMVWSRRLTDTELTMLVADPFGWYSSRRETLILGSPYPLFGAGSFLREVSSG